MAWLGRPPTHQEVKHQLWAKYDLDISSGKFVPFTYPFSVYGFSLVMLYFLAKTERLPSDVLIRWLIWAVNFILAVYCILFTRARSATHAYGVGIGNAWSILWFTAILLANDGKRYFNRIERIRGATLTIPVPATLELPAGQAEDYEIPLLEAPLYGNEKTGKVALLSSATATELRALKYYAQYIPTQSFLERLDWTLDLMTNFRGMAWNWRTPNLALPPPKVIRDIQLSAERIPVHRLPFPNLGVRGGQYFNGGGRSGPISRHVRREPTKAELLRRAWTSVIGGYMMLDVFKTLAIHDPYFSGTTNWPAPTYFPPWLASSAILVKCYRLTFGMIWVYLALQTVFSLAPVFFVGVLGANLIGVRGEPWVYPEEWGSYSVVFDRGLAGWWGVWWHQSFRFAFEAPTTWVLRRFRQPDIATPTPFSSCSPMRSQFQLAGRNRDPGMGAKAFQLFAAFILSGCLHACASHTSIGDSNPISGAFLFFALQPLGILLQMTIVKGLRLNDRSKTSRSTRNWRLKVFNLVYTHVWFYLTAPFFVRDLAKSGIYLFEPVPISLLRALGFGTEGDSWWCWDGPWLSWHRSDRWWERGIAFH